jgi:hypothetical protein
MRALLGGQRPHAARLDVRQDGGQVLEVDLHGRRQKSLSAGAVPVRDVEQVDPGLLLEHLGQQVRRAADPGNGGRHGLGRRLGQRDELGERLRRHRQVHRTRSAPATITTPVRSFAGA